ncbi:MAG: DNA topoisomerase I [Desulfamplus sp.]|nr:DNA topoisomerase I [Desulfamplus sp.]
MNRIILADKELDPTFVKSQFDEILVREITSLIEIDSDIALLTYNLSTISTIIIAVEREREIRTAKGFPPKRFTSDTLTNELVDLGLSRDNTLIKSISSVIEQGYLTQNSQGEIKAEVSAYTIVGFIDKMFPGMPGIQLIAFVMQMIDEVLSERKTLEYAKESFAQTLKKSGVSVSREKAERKARELSQDDSESRQIKDVALKLKEANIKRLAQQRLREKLQISKSGGKPSFHFDGGSRLDKVRITSVFDHGPSKEEIEAEQRAKQEAERQYQETKLAEIKAASEIEHQKRKLKEAEEAAIELEKKAAELAAKEQALKDAQMAALKLEQQQAELRAKEAEMAAREAELRLREEQLKKAAQKEAIEKAALEQHMIEKIAAEKAALDMAEKIRLETETRELREQQAKDEKRKKQLEIEQTGKENSSVATQNIPDDIESRIAAFEADLTIPCPVCHNGTIKKEKTETGKDYFICSDKSCRFVSWSQPYHFQCPLCKNSFLVDFQTGSGTTGLKCPRASCSFSQNSLVDPKLAHSITSESPKPPTTGYAPQPGQTPGDPSPKKKRLVRRVKRTS